MNPIIKRPVKGLSVVGILTLLIICGARISNTAPEVEKHSAHEHGEHPEESTVVEEHVEHVAEHENEEHQNEHEHSAEALRLTRQQIEKFGISVEVAAPGILQREVALSGEVVFNEDNLVHIVPRVDGVAREVHKSMGDAVEAKELLVVLYSRELADAKADYLAAAARAVLMRGNLARQKKLRDKNISSEQEFLETELELAEAEIELRSTRQKLYALDLSEQTVAGLSEADDETLTRYEIRSPIDGVVVEKHVALGESLDASSDILAIADLSTVWVNLTVYTKDINAVAKGADVLLCAEHDGARAHGRIAMMTPFVEESTRSATARVVLDNSDRSWIPGTFVTGLVVVGREDAAIVVPRCAVQNIEGRDVIFVEHEDAFEIVQVRCGRLDRLNVEILSGIEPGTRYVVGGAYQLKATVVTSNMNSHAGHGH